MQRRYSDGDTRDRVAGLLSISQEGYVKKVLRSFNIYQSKAVATPMGGSLQAQNCNRKRVEGSV